MHSEETRINPFAEDLNFAYAETIGQRSGQEDYCLFKSYSIAAGPKLLAILADGMGGHAAGARASHMAVETFLKSFTNSSEGKTAGKTAIKNSLSNAVKESNIFIEGAQSANAELAGMGCTLVGLYVEDRSFHWVSVGDSPLYLYRQGRLTRLNEDHSMAPLIASALAKGNLTHEEAENFPSKNALRSAIMGKPIELMDLSEAQLFQEGDVLILASDGLLTLTESEIEAELKHAPHRNAKDFAQRLLNAVIAKEKPRQDNTTIMVIAPGKSLFAGQPAAVSVKPPINNTARSSLFIVLAALIAVVVLTTAVGAYLAYNNMLSVDSIVQTLSGKPEAPKEKAVQPQPQQSPPPLHTPQTAESSGPPLAVPAEPPVIAHPSDSKNIPETTNSPGKSKDKEQAVSGKK